MFCFTDLNGYRVDLFFDNEHFEIEPKHVLAIVKKEHQYLCTIHPERGVEFPGGKMELGETIIEAAMREVMEETNVLIQHAQIIGHYIVRSEHPFCKAIVLAKVSEELDLPFSHETKGRIWLNASEIAAHEKLSFYMKDEGMKQILQEVEKR